MQILRSNQIKKYKDLIIQISIMILLGLITNILLDHYQKYHFIVLNVNYKIGLQIYLFVLYLCINKLNNSIKK